jgi:hypothetical protein
MIGFPGEHHDSARRTIAFFKDNAELFDDPGNTFDIHELEILTDTPYFSQADKFGIRINAATQGRDFLFGIGTNWENTDGLTRAEVAALLGEAGDVIGPRFSRYHAWPPVVWPAQEEWSLIYADRYFGQPFPHRVSISDGSDNTLYRLAWNPAATVERSGGSCIVTSRRGSVTLDQGSFQVLGQDSRYRPGPDIVARLAGRDATDESRTNVERFVVGLIRQRLLDIVCAPAHDVDPQGVTLS